jgi:hypothetical protein
MLKNIRNNIKNKKIKIENENVILRDLLNVFEESGIENLNFNYSSIFPVDLQNQKLFMNLLDEKLIKILLDSKNNKLKQLGFNFLFFY